MKRIIITTVLVLVGIIGLQAQTVDSHKSNFQRSQLLFAPFYLFDATFMMSYEYLLTDNSALRITPSITFIDDDDSYKGFGIDLGYKAFLLGNSRWINVYVGPYAYYKYIKSAKRLIYPYYIHEYDVIDNILGLGIDTGVKFTFGRFVLDFTFGGGIRYPLNDNRSSPSKSIVPRANLMFGITL